MFKKSLLMLKNNPLLIFLFLLAILIYAISMILFIPDMKKIMDITKEITANPTKPSAMDLSQMTAMILSTMKLYLFMLILYILGPNIYGRLWQYAGCSSERRKGFI
jgi:hypothetical protein